MVTPTLAAQFELVDYPAPCRPQCGFLGQFAMGGLDHGFTRLDHAAGQTPFAPVRVLAPLHQQQTPLPHQGNQHSRQGRGGKFTHDLGL